MKKATTMATVPKRASVERGIVASMSAVHGGGEGLAGQLQPDPDHQRGERQQQEAEGGTLLPIEPRDELVIDLLGEPQAALAAEQGRSDVVAQRQHEYDDGAR